MLVSVIIPNLHSPIIDKTIESLRSQTYKGAYEVIVVGQDKYHLVSEDELVTHFVTSSPVPPGTARNIGIKNSRGDILSFIDSDCVANKDWLELLLSNYSSSEISVVGGGVSFPTENYWTLCDNLASFHDYLTTSPKGFREQLPSINFSVCRKALDQVGLFDERYTLGSAAEDSDLSMRLRLSGYKLFFDPKATIVHLPSRRTIKSVFVHAYNFGRHSIRIDPRYRDYLKTPIFLRSWWLALISSPIIASGVVIKMMPNSLILKNIHTLPIVYFIKLAWCFGAAHTLYKGPIIKD